jgi:hypothetical protein
VLGGEKSPTFLRDYNIHSPKGKESLSGLNPPTIPNSEKLKCLKQPFFDIIKPCQGARKLRSINYEKRGLLC